MLVLDLLSKDKFMTESLDLIGILVTGRYEWVVLDIAAALFGF